MIFDSISCNDINVVNNCEIKFNQLLIDLSVSKNNKYGCSHIGGNEWQITTLMQMKHNLVEFSEVDLCGSSINWGTDFLLSNSFIDIRNRLNILMKDVAPDLALNGVVLSVNYNNIKSIFDKCSLSNNSLPTFIMKDYSISNQMIITSIACLVLAEELDAGMKPDLEKFSELLIEAPPYILLLAFKKYLRVERFLKYHLDEDTNFRKLIHKVLNTNVLAPDCGSSL